MQPQAKPRLATKAQKRRGERLRMSIILSCSRPTDEPRFGLAPELVDLNRNESEVIKTVVMKGAAGQRRTLVAIKILHTAIWAFFAGCIVALPAAAWLGRFRMVVVLTALILMECCVLAVNRWRCPLTDLAERYTEDRSPDYDIYLPLWLARHNKTVFGALFIFNELIVLERWVFAR